jgi:hypothetical protein
MPQHATAAKHCVAATVARAQQPPNPTGSYVKCPEAGEMTDAERKAVIALMPPDAQKRLSSLELKLNEKTVDAFLDPLEEAAEDVGLRVKRADKKRDKKVAFEHRARLQSQLEDVSDPPSVLLLVAVLLFQGHTGCVLHAQGRSVPQIITFLKEAKGALSAADTDLLVEYQRKVMASLTSAAAGDDAITEEDTAAVKALAARRPTKTNNDDE